MFNARHVSKPVPDKVLDDMRSCDAAVIHLGAEIKMMGPDAACRGKAVAGSSRAAR